jgi:DNA polymerase-1
MSGDPELVRSFQKDEDVHRRTAGEIFRVAPDQVNDRQRSIAKAINFGLMYGKTAFGLAQELKIPRKEAADIIQRYFERYAAVKKFLDGQIQEARDKGYVCTLLGRKRHLPDIGARNPAIRAVAERMAMNTPIQGTAADLMKIAMTEIDHELTRRKMQSKLIIQVHDEVVLDCPVQEVDAARELITEIMESAMKLDVPLKVNSASGESWYDL